MTLILTDTSSLLALDRLSEAHAWLKSFSVVFYMEGYLLIEHGINESYIWHGGKRRGIYIRTPSLELADYCSGSENEAWAQLPNELLRIRRNE